MFSNSKSARKTKPRAYTPPGRQRALARRSTALGILALVVVILTLAQFGESGLATLFKLQSQENELATDVELIEGQNEVLQDQLIGLASDPDVLETLAREEHDMQLPHEEVLTVLPPDSNP